MRPSVTGGAQQGSLDNARLRLLKQPPDRDVVVRPADVPGTRARGERIRCPRCGWEPRRSDRWSCTCGCIWNTFETRGRCPACGKAWQETQCLRCFQWSRHEDWYVADEESPGAA
jgi:hypothetical protein